MLSHDSSSVQARMPEHSMDWARIGGPGQVLEDGTECLHFSLCVTRADRQPDRSTFAWLKPMLKDLCNSVRFRSPDNSARPLLADRRGREFLCQKLFRSHVELFEQASCCLSHKSNPAVIEESDAEANLLT